MLKLSKLLLTLSLIFTSYYSFSSDVNNYVFIDSKTLRKSFERCGIIKNRKDIVISLSLSQSQYGCVISGPMAKNGFKALGNNSVPVHSLNESIVVERSKNTSNKADSEVLFLAKEDFGLIEYLKENPTHDGRGIIAGVIDDGVSPLQSGFQLTSTGERKYIRHYSNSSYYQVKVTPSSQDEILLEGPKVLLGELDEESFDYDLNIDNKKTKIAFKVTVPRDPTGLDVICADLNSNNDFEDNECTNSFNLTGKYLVKENGLDVIMVEFDRESSIVTFNEGEGRGDSHGEGVASVLLGHNIGGRFDGVAPGAKLIDYDLSERGANADESAYTIGKFLMAIELLAKNGASVINISYSLYFSSIESQMVMRSAIENISNEYECLIVFSAGNNGPGLGSLNRSAIYPHNSLRTGAYVGQKLDEYVHGVTGLPDEGRVIYYSSRGPGAMGGAGPSLISPLASLTHADIRNGFRGFSGTSSASPALAGFATVFKSAIIESGRQFNFESFVYAIKYSGRRIKNSPYVEQGYGLPKIRRALKVYDLMIKGEFPRVTSVVVDKFLRWGFPSEGLLLKRSELGQFNQFFAYFTNQFPSTISATERMNTALPVAVESSLFIDTVEHSWMDHGTNRIGFSIDEEKINWGSDTEIFGEIIIKAINTNIPVAVVPVTLIDDTPFKSSRRYNVSIGSEEGQRIHLNIEDNVKAIKFNANLLTEDDDRIMITLFDPYGIRVQRKWLNSFSMNTFYFPVSEQGHYQVGISRSKGTNTETKFDLSLSPISISLVSNFISMDDDKKVFLNVKNNNNKISGSLSLTFKQKPVEKKYVRYQKEKGFFFEWPVSSFGDHELIINSPDNKFSYLLVRCFHKVDQLDEQRGFDLNISEDAQKISTRCIPFDFFNERENGDTLIFSWSKKIDKKVFSSIKSLSRGDITKFKISLEDINEGLSDMLEIDFRPSDGASNLVIPLGRVVLIK